MSRPLSAFRCKEVFRKTHNVTVEAVAQDNLNDVLTNAVALASALAAASVAPLWVVDPIGAILLSLFIIGSWVRAAAPQSIARGRVAACAYGACMVRAWCMHGPPWCRCGVQASTCGVCIACRLPPSLSQVSTAIEQVEMIIGRSADAEFLDVVRQPTTLAHHTRHGASPL